MKLKYIFIILVILVSGCGQANNKEQKEDTKKQNGETMPEVAGSTQETQKEANNFWEKMQMNELRDANGMVSALMPLPASWKFMAAKSNGGPSITGPNGIKVTDFPSKSFMYNYNPNLQYAYSQGSQQMREMPGVEQLIQQDLVPWAANNGLQFVKYYEILEISKMDKWYSDQLYKAMPSRFDIAAIGTEWKDANGNPYFLLIHLNVSTSQAMQTWYYFTSGLEADPDHFESAIKQFIFGLANMRYNLQPIMVYNQQEAQRCGQSWAAHNQRMAQNQANFEASQRAFVNKSNAINDAIMNGWNARNAASDKNQEQFLDVINERENVVDPTTGQGYKVSAGANQYWMNSNGEYIGTKLNDYNPNQDDNMNQEKWQQLKLRKDN